MFSIKVERFQARRLFNILITLFFSKLKHHIDMEIISIFFRYNFRYYLRKNVIYILYNYIMYVYYIKYVNSIHNYIQYIIIYNLYIIIYNFI